MNVVDALQLITAVVCNDLSGCTVEKMVTGTFNSLVFPTFCVIHTSIQGMTDIVAGPWFKDPLCEEFHCHQGLQSCC
jgi:hypothetical protein